MQSGSRMNREKGNRIKRTGMLLLVMLEVIMLVGTGQIGRSNINMISNYINANYSSMAGDIASSASSEIHGIVVNGEEHPFITGKTEYDIMVPYYDELLNFEFEKGNENQTIMGQTCYAMDENLKTIDFTVASEDKTNKTQYVVHLHKDHNIYLKNLEIRNYAMTPAFAKETTQYYVYIPSGVQSIDISAIAYDRDSAIRVIKGEDTEIIMSGSGSDSISGTVDNIDVGSEVTVVVSNPGIDYDLEYKLTVKASTFKADASENTYNYSYTGNYQEFTALYSGVYQMECYGGYGGKARANGSVSGGNSLGGYAKGEITVKKGQKFYVYVGQNGINATVKSNSAATWNGGGQGSWDQSDDETCGSGGGATDIRLVPGNWNNTTSLASRIMVAGGAGGSAWDTAGGVGGGISGGRTNAAPGTQTGGYAFGFGQNGTGSGNASNGLPGGGGGYWGGRYALNSDAEHASGGSGFISGHSGCIAIKSESEIAPKVQTFTKISDSYHYSGLIFNNTTLTAGGGTGGSKAAISTIKYIDEVYPIVNVTVDKGTMTRAFNQAENEYYIELDSEEGNPTISFTTSSDDVVVEGGLTQTIETVVGDNVRVVNVKSPSGLEYTYTFHFIRGASADSRLRNIEINGKSLAGFSEDIYDYTFMVPYNFEGEVSIEGLKKFKEQYVDGNGTVTIDSGITTCPIEVTSEDGKSTSIYNINIQREPSTRLKYLELNEEGFNDEFDSETFIYDFTASAGIASIDVTAIPYDDNAKVVIKGAGYIRDGRSVVKVIVSRDGVEDSVYQINVTKGEQTEEIATDFPYTGGYQTFIAPVTGLYKFEAWGAGGGRARLNGSLGGTAGRGGYTSGVIKLQKDDVIYVYVGGQGANAVTKKNSAGGYNGGGLGSWDNSDDESSGGGGGATDFRLVSGAWNNTESLYSRIMVAGAGGGASWSYRGGAGGGLNGYSYYSASSGGTQTSGWTLGTGRNGWGVADSDGVAGGGAGYWGGQTNNVKYQSAGAGGSSYISGHDGCNSTGEDGKPTGSAVHYSNYKFKKTVMIDGDGYEWANTKLGYVQMVNSDGNYVVGNTGNGYARITKLKEPSQDNLLKDILTSKGSLDPEYDINEQNYTIHLSPDDTEIEIKGIPNDVKATVDGNGVYEVKPGENIFELNVTAESEDVRTYTVKVVRDASTNSKPLDITIDGLIPSIINVNPEYYGVLSPGEFDPETHEYSMVVPNRIKKLIFNVEKSHKNQIVENDGPIELEEGLNQIVIRVTAEDEEHWYEYTYNITRDTDGNCLLKFLVINNTEGILKEMDDFDQDVLEYYTIISSNITDLDITAIPEKADTQVVINGNTDLEYGLNDIYVIATAKNGEQLTYIIHAYKQSPENVMLSSIKVKTLDGTVLPMEPEFNEILSTYIVNVDKDVDKVVIEATPEDLSCTVTGTGEKNLKAGTNTFPITITSRNGKVGTYTININRDQSSNCYLKTLITTLGDFNEEFDKYLLQYSITVADDVTSLPLTIEPEDPRSSYEVLQNNNFITGENVVIIRVTAENGDKKDYRILVNKEASQGNYLKNIILNKGTLVPGFTKENTEYTVNVDNSVTQINVNGIKELESSTVTGNGIYALEEGTNEITLIVTAENGSTRNYTLTVNRAKSANTNLLKVVSEKGQTANKIDYRTYKLNVSNDTERITITGIPETETSVVTGNGEMELILGENHKTLTVTAQDGTKKEYDIIIERGKSANANLISVYAEEGVLHDDFDKETTEYTIKVQNDVESLTLEIEPEDKFATYEVIGNEDFGEGENQVIIRVTASDGLTKKDYTLTVIKQADIGDVCDLLTLSVNPGTLIPEFDPEVVTYTVKLTYENEAIEVSATSSNASATITGIGEHSLNPGMNVIPVVVTTSDGKEKDYQINVLRMDSDNANLAKLMVQGETLEPTFDKLVTIYNVETNQSEIKIEATPEDENATYQILGNTKLKKGVNLIVVEVTSPSGKVTKDYILKVNKTVSDNNNLANLWVEGYDISPEFNKTQLLYSLDVPNDVKSVYIDAEADDADAVISGTGYAKLEDGRNTFHVLVTSGSGKSKTYTIVINRELSSNAYLSQLLTSEGELVPEFVKTSNEYTLYVDKDIENVIVMGYPEESTSTVSGIGRYNLVDDETLVTLKVTAANGDSNNYRVNIVKKQEISAKLKYLEIQDYKLVPQFNQNTNEYMVNVDNQITSVDMIIETVDPNATYVVTGNENFKVGNNIVTIEVTARDGETKEIYTINVNRQVYSNNFLSYILPSVGSLDPDFDKTNLSYVINVPNDVTDIKIDAEPEDKSATVSGVGEYDLDVGSNNILLDVTSGMGVKRTYKVKVIRAKNSNNYLRSLQINVDSEPTEITPIFSKEVDAYSITVPMGTTKIQFVGEPESALSTVDGLGYIVIPSDDNSTEIVKQIVVTAEDGSKRTYMVTINRELSNIDNLIDLIPSCGTLAPSFVYGTDVYDLILGDSDSLLSFEVEREDRFSTVSGNEELEVPNGESTREIVVTAQNGDTKKYTINVNRIRTDDARLKSLRIASVVGQGEGTGEGGQSNNTVEYQLTPEFNSDVYEYSITVPSDKLVLYKSEITAEPIQENTKIYPVESISLASLEPQIYTIKTIAEDGFTTQYYRITVNREKSNNCNLASLRVIDENNQLCEITPIFDKDTISYSCVVPVKTENVEILATAEQENAKIEGIGVQTIALGENNKQVIVTAEDGTEKKYAVKIIRPADTNNYLSKLVPSIGTLDPAFDKDEDQYTILVGNEDYYISFETEPEEKLATVSGDEETYIEDGINIREIKVRAEDGNIRTYTVNVIKNRTNDPRLRSLAVTSYELDKEFSPDVYEYTITVPNSKTILLDEEVVAIPKYEASDVTETESVVLSVGNDNTFEINVVSPDGTKSAKYTITINRHKSCVLKGKVTTQNVYNKHVAKVSVYKSGVLEYEEVTAEDGTYEIEVALGQYDVVVSKAGYLGCKIMGLDFAEEEQEITIEDIDLVAGNVVCNDSNLVSGGSADELVEEIEIDDLVALSNACGTVITDENRNSMGLFDLNEDGVVDSLDRGILKGNYGVKEMVVVRE